MREHYDFSNSQPNPYAKRMRKKVSISLNATLDDNHVAEASPSYTDIGNINEHVPWVANAA